jgi:hypothetical protein
MSDERGTEMNAVYTHDEKGKRVDVHAPSVINPGDYEYVKVGCNRKDKVTGGPAGTCHHCGKAIVWEVVWKHLPSDTLVTFGETCTEILGMSNNRIDHEMVLLKRQAANEMEDEKRKAAREDREYKFRTQHPDLYKFVMEFDEENSYIARLKWGIEKFGSPQDYHIDGLKRFIAGREKYLLAKMEESRKLDNAPNLTDGRQHIEGVVVSVKPPNQAAQFPAWKMLVQMDDGNKVFGTIPNSLYLAVGILDNLKGERVSFDAKVEAKEDHFGFFSRPSKAVKL